MATIKRTTQTTVQARPRTLPSLNQSGRPGRAPEEPTHLPELPPDNQAPPDNEWPDLPTDPEAEQQAVSDVVTVGQEQLERSREMQEMGIHNWIAAHDEREPADQPQQVAGVGPYER